MTFQDTYPNGVDAAIRASIPGYTEAVAARDALQKLQPQTTGAHEHDYQEVAARLRDLVAAGELTSESALEVARQVQADYAAFSLQVAGISYAREEAAQEIKSAGTAHPGPFLDGYSRAFGVLMAEVAELEPLKQITTLAAAVEAGRVEDHRCLQQLLDAYTSLRSQHFKLLADNAYFELPEAAVFPDVRAHFPHWAAWRSHGFLENRRSSATSEIRPPWPSKVLGPGVHRNDGVRSREAFRSDAGRPEFLFWASKAGAVLWMPNAAEFEAAQSDLDAALTPEARPVDDQSEWVDPAVKDARFPEHRELPLSVKLSEGYRLGGPIPLGLS